MNDLHEGLVFDSVAIRLGGREVVRDVSFAVGPGEVVGLLGQNGAGKTTLLRAANRAVVPHAGRILLGGRPIASFGRKELARRLASVPQEIHVPFPFLAGELVLMGRAPHQGLFGFEGRHDLELARKALEQVRIAELADRPISELSGGERQLVMFARALAQQPELLLLDEPTAFLDLRHRIDVLRVVRELVGSGRGALVVSHDLGLAARICDRIVLLADGVVVADGAPREVLTREVVRQAFAIETDVLVAPDGTPLVVPRFGEPV